MYPVERIVIAGFRGLPVPLELSFLEGNTAKSLILYGRNGTGKSSITDGWEWFTSNRILHLAREGAEESSYNPGSKVLTVSEGNAVWAKHIFDWIAAGVSVTESVKRLRESDVRKVSKNGQP